MSKYNTISLAIVCLFAGYVIGAKTFNPTILYEYKLGEELFIKCRNAGGIFRVEDNVAFCTLEEILFERPVNQEFWQGMYNE